MSIEQALINFTLHLADDALILGHRNSEWTGHGPILEQDIAISNIALDLIGQARNFYQYAALLINQSGGVEAGGVGGGFWSGGVGTDGVVTDVGGRGAAGAGANGVDKGSGGVRINGGERGSGEAGGRGPGVVVMEDSLAYLRDAWDFKNCLLVEQANGDWGKTILRQFFFSAAQYALYDQLRYGKDAQLAAISEKASKEVAYHLRWSSEWVIRLGDGTYESHTRMKKSLDELWKFTGELFIPSSYEQQLAKEGIGVDLSLLRPRWEERVREIFSEARLSYPGEEARKGGDGGEGADKRGGGEGGVGKKSAGGVLSGGKEGRHTEELGYILAEMQFLQRAYPGCEW